MYKKTVKRDTALLWVLYLCTHTQPSHVKSPFFILHVCSRTETKEKIERQKYLIKQAMSTPSTPIEGVIDGKVLSKAKDTISAIYKVRP